MPRHDTNTDANDIDRDWREIVAWHDEAEFIGTVAQFLNLDNLRPSFEAYLEARCDVYPVIEYYTKHGDWRASDPDAIPDDTYRELRDRMPNAAPNNCYYNAQTGLLPEVTYCEGYAVNTEFPAVVPHAWVEHGGSVMDITPTVNAETAEYFGVAFDNSTVREAMAAREQADPIVEYVLNE
ncbi:hypothetical protein [Salinibaculum rarum]|uniref:hypothetical protein n=1 Tax=Salinibaculum rarum TaxID=3058903 RepID=UPI00265E4B2B|nr:hypothetical protein [Salinibaculum sp. KK48]